MKMQGKPLVAALLICLSSAGLAWAAEPALPAVPDYGAVDLRDPFESYVQKEEAPVTQRELVEEEFNPPVLKIQGITWGSSFPQAIVNNKVVRANDTIDGVEVISIKSNAVIFKFQNREFTLAGPATVSAGKEQGKQ